ncbi:MAG: DUF4347 domain-containing protein, partial [Deltaproteobacteria bacterium]|nr:DUF4347 domain-containing protein [Deltaproteobacteria bacterium]
MARKLAKKQPEVLRYEELEQRVLFSADLMPGLDADTDAVYEQVLVEDVAGVTPTDSTNASDPAVQVEETRHELVFVNDNVTDYQQLIDELQQQDGNRILEVVTLDSTQSGIDQVSDILSEQTSLDAIHIISHGNDGSFALGSDWLDNNDLLANSEAISTWGDSLSEDADILLYGCNIAVDNDGQLLTETLANLTDADVASSEDITGHEDLGGDWDLEYDTGAVETEALSAGQWEGLLADTTLVTADTGSLAWSGGQQGAVFYNGENYFLVYKANASDILYKTSADNVTWSTAQTLATDSLGTAFDLSLVDDNKFDLIYLANGEDIKVLTATISGQVITPGTASTVASGVGWTGVSVTRTPSSDRIWVSARDDAELVVYSADQIGDADGVSSWTGEVTTEDSYVTYYTTLTAYGSADKVLVVYVRDPGGTAGDGFYSREITREGGAGTSVEIGDLNGFDKQSAVVRVSDTEFHVIVDTVGTAPQEYIWDGTDWSAGETIGSASVDSVALIYDRSNDDFYAIALDTSTDDIMRFHRSNDGSWDAGTVADGGEAATHSIPIVQKEAPPLGSARTTSQIVWAYMTDDGLYDLYVGNLGITPTVIDLDGDDSSGTGGGGYAAIWTEAGGAVAIVDTDAVVTDDDDTHLESLTVTITNPADAPNEILGYDTTGTGIVGSYDAATGVLSLTGTDTVANYQTVLRTITYNNTSSVSDDAARTITFVAHDGFGNSNTATATVSINATNAAPVNTVPAAQSTPQDTELVFSSGNGNQISISDPDAGSNEVQVTLSVDNGTLTLGSTGGPVDGQFRVNSTIGGSQYEPRVATNANGNFVVVWSGDDVSGSGVYARRYDANGAAQGVEWLVNTETADTQGMQDVAMDPNGNFVVTWASYSQDANATWGVYAQRYDASGVAQGTEFLVNTTVSGEQSHPTVAMDANGNIMFAWTGKGGGTNYGSVARLYDSAGVALTGEFMVADEQTDSGGFDIASDTSGNFVVVWSNTGRDGDSKGVGAQRFNSAGVAQGAAIDVNTTTTSAQTSPSIAMDSAGNFVVAWESYNQNADSTYDIFAQRFNASGVAQGDEFQVNTNTTDHQTMASVSMASSGEFVVTWRSANQDGDNYGVYGQKYDAAGVVLGDEFLVNTTTAGLQQSPSVAMSDADSFVVAWSGAGPVDTLGIFAQRYADNGLTFTTGDGTDDTTMTFTGTIADINTALEGSTFTPTASFNGTATVTITTDDLCNTGTGGALSDIDVVTITVGNANAPVVNLDTDDSSGAGGNDFSTIWTEGSGAVAIVDTDGTLIDSDENLTSLTVTITNLLNGTAESLTANAGATGLSVNYDSGTGVLTISGAGTAAQYQQVLRTVTYNNTSDTPTTTARIITFTATDAVSNGNTATTTLTVQATNDAPVNSIPGAQTTPEDMELVFFSGNGNAITISDTDATSAEVTLTATNGIISVNLDGSIGSETLVNTTTGGIQEQADIAVAADGSYVVAWASQNQDGDGYGVYAQRYDADGNAVGGEIPVNTSTTGDQTNPSIAMDDAGNFVVTWQTNHVYTTTTSVFAQRFDADGTGHGEFRVDGFMGANMQNPTVAMNATGAFVIAFEAEGGFDGNLAGIYAKWYDSDGVSQGSGRVNDFGTNDQTSPAVAMDGAGNFVVVWQSYGQDNATAGWGVYGQRYDADGNEIDGEFLINTDETVYDEFEPSVAMDSDGNFVVAWTGIEGNLTQAVFTQLFDNSGAQIGGNVRVNTENSLIQDAPSVAMQSNGDFTVVWNENYQEGAGNYGIYGQRYTSGGAADGGEFRINTTTTGDQVSPAVGVDQNGRIVVAWSGEGPDDTSGVFVQRMDSVPSLTFTAGDGTDDTTMTFTGTIDDINTALDGLTFTPTASFNGTATVTITTDDLGNTGTGGALSDIDVVSITVGTANEAPTTSGIADVTVDEDAADTVINLFAAFADVEDPDSALTYSIESNTNAGLFDVTTIDGVAGTLTLDYAADQNGTADITVRATDTGGEWVESSFTVTIDAVNDAPTASATAIDPTYTEGNIAVDLFSTVTLNTVESGQTIEQIVLTVSNVTDGSNETITVDGSIVFLTNGDNDTTGSGYDYMVDIVGNTATITIDTVGTSVADAQTLIDGLSYQNTSENPSTLDRVFTITSIQDSGGTANGGIDTSSPNLVSTVTVVAVNDDPTNAGSLPSDLVFIEDTQGKLNLSAIDLSDVDAGSGDLTLTITSDNGHLQTMGWPGLTLGGSQSVLILTGNLTDLNDFLNDANSIDYEHATPNMSGDNVDLITIEITDNGNTGSGGGGTITLGTVNIDVTAANDAPTAANNTVTTNENTTYTFSASDFNFTDIDGDTLASVKITSLETAGSLQLSGGDVTLNQVITKADIDAGNLKFVPVADANGTDYDSFEFTVNDGTFDSLTAYTMTVDVTAVNDAPVGLPTITGTVTEDQTLTADTSGISDIDGLGAFSYQWLHDGNAIGGATAGTYTLGDDDVGTLISVQVSYTDGQGTLETLTSAQTAAVININDAPEITVDATVLLYATGEILAIDPALLVTDVDDTHLESAIVRFKAGYLPSEDYLLFTYQSGITGSFTSGLGILTLTGTATIEEYQTALRSVQYENKKADPTEGTLYVDFTVFDGTDSSLIDTREIAVIDGSRPRAGEDLATVDEGGSVLIDVAANDTDGENMLDLTSIVIASGPTYGSLTVNGDGTVTYTHDGSENFTDTFTYTIEDATSFVSNAALVSITINPVNDNTPLIDDLTTSVAEDAAYTTLVTDLNEANTGNDTDIDGDALTYSITAGNADGIFAIDAATGEITVSDSTNLDYEITQQYVLTVEATDGTNTDTAAITLDVIDVDEFDVGAVTDSNAAANEIAENAANGTVVGVTALATDADATNNAITYSLSDDAGGRFTINGSTGIVTVADGTLLNREADASHTITVLATSADTSTDTAAITLDVIDVDEFDVGAVTDSDAAANEVAENAANGTVVGVTALATDADAT